MKLLKVGLVQEMTKKRPEYWKAPAVLWFLEQSDKVDPEEAIRAKAQELLSYANAEGPPFEPTRMAHLRKIHTIKRAGIRSVSQLVPVKSGFILTVNSTNKDIIPKQV